MKKYYSLYLLLFFGILFQNCSSTKSAEAGAGSASNTDVLLPEIDVIQIKEDSDEALKLTQEAKLDVEALYSRVTELDNKIHLLYEELSQISALKIDEMDIKIAIIVEELKNVHEAVKEIAKMKLTPPKIKKRLLAIPTFGPNDLMKDRLPVNEELKAYRLATAYFNRSTYSKSIKAFRSTIKANPNGKYADKSQFWIGESYFALKEYANAIAQYQRVFSYGQSNKLDDAQLKIGVCYLKNGRPEAGGL